MKEIQCVKCGEPPAFPNSVQEPYTCLACLRTGQTIQTESTPRTRLEFLAGTASGPQMIVQVKDVESLLLEVSNLKTEVARHKFNANQAQQDLQMLGPKIEELRARIAKLEWPKDAVVC